MFEDVGSGYNFIKNTKELHNFTPVKRYNINFVTALDFEVGSQNT